jgi:GntR family transcriptional regulator, transcriptional repressor for pyruvate dehydrogenase complex
VAVDRFIALLRPVADDEKAPLVDVVAATLQDAIRAAALATGDRLPSERTLAEMLAVSRSTIREALHELELKGLVERQRGRGTLVAGRAGAAYQDHLLERLGADRRTLLEVMDFREAVEAPTAARAAQSATEADLRGLRSLVESMGRTRSSRRYVVLDGQFHLGVARATHNALWARVVEWSVEWMTEARSPSQVTAHHRGTSVAGHRAILASMEAGNPEAAAAAMLGHLRSVRDEMGLDRGGRPEA